MEQLTREDFKQLYYIDKEIGMLDRELERIRTRGTRCTAQLSDMPRGGGLPASPVEGAAVEAVPLEEILVYAKRKRETEYRRLVRVINHIPDAEMRVLLFHRYIRGLPWETVAKEMNSTLDAVKSKDKRFFQLN